MFAEYIDLVQKNHMSLILTKLKRLVWTIIRQFSWLTLAAVAVAVAENDFM